MPERIAIMVDVDRGVVATVDCQLVPLSEAYAAVEQAMRERNLPHITPEPEGRTVTIDIPGLEVTIEFVRRLEVIKQAFERGEIQTAEEYHKRVQAARTEWELTK